jgi:hypothetical protein
MGVSACHLLPCPPESFVARKFSVGLEMWKLQKLLCLIVGFVVGGEGGDEPA